jgi:hypothetical protein
MHDGRRRAPRPHDGTRRAPRQHDSQGRGWPEAGAILADGMSACAPAVGAFGRRIWRLDVRIAAHRLAAHIHQFDQNHAHRVALASTACDVPGAKPGEAPFAIRRGSLAVVQTSQLLQRGPGIPAAPIGHCAKLLPSFSFFSSLSCVGAADPKRSDGDTTRPRAESLFPQN